MDLNDGHRSMGTKTVQRVRRFQEHWKEQYPWVYYDELLGKMFCRTCREHAEVCDPASAYFSGGCSNFQLMSLASHAKSKGHLTAEEMVRMHAYPSGQDMDESLLRPSSQSSSSGISPQLYMRASDVCSSGRDLETRREREDDVNIEDSVSSYNIASSEERMRLLRMAAEEAWRSVGPGSYNVPFSLDFTQAYDQGTKPQFSGISKRNAAPAIHHAFSKPIRIQTVAKVESVSPQSSNIPVGYPHTVQSPLDSSETQKLKNLCLNAHAVAKKGLSYQDYQWMFELDKAKGCDVGETTTIKEYQNLQTCISDSVQTEIMEAARSKFFSILCDRVSGLSGQMRVIYLKTVDSGKTFVHILSVQSLSDESRSDSLTNAISSAFRQELKDIDFDWKDHFVGFSCSDSTHLNIESPVEDDDVQQCSSGSCGDADKVHVIKHEPEDADRDDDDDLSRFLRTKNPQITSLHCTAQMINAACRDLNLDCHKHFEKLVTCICSISRHFPCNSSENINDQNAKKITCKRPSQIRENKWIKYTLHNALFVIRNFSRIVDCFNKIVDGDRQLYIDRSRECLRLMLTQRFVKYIHFLVDLLEVLSHVCHVITQPSASIGEVYEAISDATDNLMKLKKRSGQQLAKVENEQNFCGHALTVDEEQEFEQDKTAILTEITAYMTSRVPDLDERTMTSMTKLVCLSQWPSDTEQLKDYAEDDLLRIVDQFARTFRKHGVNTDKCLMEWSLLKNHIRRRCINPSNASWETVYPACKSKCENVLAVLSFILTLPGQSIDRGRVYSYLGRLPVKWRKTLSAEEVKRILRIFLHTPDVGKFEPSASMALYRDRYLSTEDSPIRKKLKVEKSDQWTSEEDLNVSVKTEF